MEQSLDKKPELKDAIQSFFNNNKKKFFLFISIVIAITITLFLWKDNNHEKNILISEKYTKAQVLLSKNEKEAATKHYEEIILSKNKFYSLLALNVILEKNLIDDKKKILQYFDILENLKLSTEGKNIVIFKKALYLMKFDDEQKGKKILKDLINKKSNLKSASEELID